MTDLLLRRAQAGRAGAQDDDNCDVIDADGLVIWRIFKATRSPSGTPWMYAGLWGPREPNVDARIYRHSLGAGTERHDPRCRGLHEEGQTLIHLRACDKGRQGGRSTA